MDVWFSLCLWRQGCGVLVLVWVLVWCGEVRCVLDGWNSLSLPLALGLCVCLALGMCAWCESGDGWEALMD